MDDLADLEPFNQLYQNIDFLLVPIYILAHTYFIYGRYFSLLSAVIYIISIMYFKLIFVAIVFVSYFVSELIVNKRVLRSSNASKRSYATFALTIIISIVMIMLATGGIEPYQGALIFLVFYIIQARYRTSTLTLARLSEINQRKSI